MESSLGPLRSQRGEPPAARSGVQMLGHGHENIANIMDVDHDVLSQLVAGWCFSSSAVEHVDHVALWLTLLSNVRQPGTHAPIDNVRHGGLIFSDGHCIIVLNSGRFLGYACLNTFSLRLGSCTCCWLHCASASSVRAPAPVVEHIAQAPAVLRRTCSRH